MTGERNIYGIGNEQNLPEKNNVGDRHMNK
jgi:hypothetical protein